jgi:hypothetical protein
MASHIRAPSASTSIHGPDPDMDPIVSRSLLALAVGVALILLGIVLAPPT